MLHYTKIVQNEHYGYPQEWFPSVSATIGDWYPERSIFQVFIAITSGPRFAICALWYLISREQPGRVPALVLVAGLIRTLSCGGWVYVTSTDDHDWHDIFMITYLVLTIPWQLGCLKITPVGSPGYRRRRLFSILFFGSIVPLIYFFIQHKVHKKAGAYTIYAFFEWSLIIYDVAFDASAATEFERFDVDIRLASGFKRSLRSSSAVEEKQNAKQRSLPHVSPQVDTFFIFDLCARILFSYLSWTTYSALPLLIWYFPLWHMGISGFEASYFVLVAPLLLLSNPIRNALRSQMTLLRLLTLLGVVAFKVHDPTARLLTVSAGCIAQTLYWALQLTSSSRRTFATDIDIVSFLFGLALHSIAKLSYYTLNPLWPTMHSLNGGWNHTGLALGALTVAVLHRSDRASMTKREAPTSQSSINSSALAFGLGGSFFLLHSMLSDSSTIILWIWDGFPIRGPLVVPHGGLLIIAMLAGTACGVLQHPRVSRAAWLAGVTSGLTLIYVFPGYPGYIGGLAFASSICGATVQLLRDASRGRPGIAFGLGYLIAVILALMHVWVVAYAFVPGGPLLRERTDIVLAVSTACLAVGLFGSRASYQPDRHAVAALHRALFGGLRLVSAALSILVFVICYVRFPTFDYQPYHAEERLLTAGIWTVHFGLDNDMWSSETRMRQIIEELELDVIGLLETDTQRLIMGQRDLTQQIAEEIGMYVDFGPGPNKHTWGCALLSKFPIIQSTHHLLPSPVGELAPAIHATLDVYGRHVDVIVSHNGQEEDPEDRRLQSLELGRIMRESKNPFIFLGYVVSVPGQYPQRHLTDDTGMHDIEPSDWDRWCEYIFLRGLKRIGYARVHRSTITDTEIQTGKFIVGDNFSIDMEPSYVRADESEIPAGQRYPAQFRGDGVRGHRYNNNEVVQEPWYYKYD
ncbi:Protein cwh43 [Savitreella phatthalungensis]